MSSRSANGRLAGSLQHGVLQHHCELPSRYWPAEIVTLGLVTSVGAEERELLWCLHAFRDDSQLEASGHSDHCLHDRRIVVGADLTDKRLVDFDGVNRKLSQIAQ